MNDQEVLGGFCFNCAVRSSQYPTGIPQTQPEHSTQLQNPWPILVRSDKLDFYNTQPLVRAFYNVDSWDRPHRKLVASRPEDRVYLYTLFNRYHEFCHLSILDWTPAKELARLALSLCYDCIHVLAYSLMPAEEVWDVFTKATADLMKIEENIGFVEELIATADAIAVTERTINPDNGWIGFQEEVERLKEIALAHEEKNFPGFRTAYEHFKPIIHLMRENSHLKSIVIPLLQPVIKNEDGSLSSANAHTHLEIVLDRWNRIKNAEEVICCLQDLVDQEREAWELTLDALLKAVKESANENGSYRPIDSDGSIEAMLWLISKGDQPDRYMSKGVQAAWAERAELGTRNYLILQQKLYRNQRYIGSVYPGVDEESYANTSKDAQEARKLAHSKLLFFEGLRQQILARKGFICPHSAGRRRCQCDHPDTQRNLQRLSHLALDGLFGPGDWSPPPCLSSERR